MQLNEYDVVRLADGSTGTIIEVWGDGEAYEFEIDFPERYDVSEVWRTVSENDIAEVLS